MACLANKQTFLSLCLLSLFFSIASSAKKIEITSRGYCGDGILNGNEECDGNDMNFTDCSVLHGGSGRLGCQDNCIYDISECESSVSENSLVTQINRRIGGIAETCKCSCSTDNCAGGCATTNHSRGQATCKFNCGNECFCSCEGKTNVHLEQCKVHCACAIDLNGNPDCSCSLSECDLLTVISHNIGFLTSGYYSGPVPIPVIVPSLPPFISPPRQGYCGDGIINGHEQCDQSAILTTHCRDLSGGDGLVKCQANLTSTFPTA